MKTITLTDKYWICDDCADKKGWKCDQIGNTVISGYCGHCKTQVETMLTPVRDFNKGNKPE